MALSTIAIEQTKATETTMGWCIQLLDYLASNQEANVRFHTLNIIMNIHSDAWEREVEHADIFFMGWMPKNGEPMKLNATFHNSSIMKFVVASAAEAELGAIFHNCQTGMIFRQTLADLGHPQPETPVHCNNTTAVGIMNNTVKCQ